MPFYKIESIPSGIARVPFDELAFFPPLSPPLFSVILSLDESGNSKDHPPIIPPNPISNNIWSSSRDLVSSSSLPSQSTELNSADWCLAAARHNERLQSVFTPAFPQHQNHWLTQLRFQAIWCIYVDKIHFHHCILVKKNKKTKQKTFYLF